MPKNVLKGLGVILGVLFLYGCTATKDVEVRHYIDVKDRIDQNMEGGNAGFIAGTPQPEDRSEIRKTRKIYVLEVSKGEAAEDEETVVVESDDAVMDRSGFQDEDLGYESGERIEKMKLRDDSVDTMMELGDVDMGKSFAPSSSVVEYTIQKDDTLQKISKKFYGSFSKWSKIYELNKDVIDDPDRIKPGVVIQIPAN